MSKTIPIKTVDNGHEQQYNNEQLILMVHRLIDERDVLWRENEYLKSKLNESLLIETLNEVKQERDLLLKLLLNLSVNNNNNNKLHNKNEQSSYQNNYYSDEYTNSFSNDLLPPPPYQTYNTTPNGKSMHNGSPSSKKHTTHIRHSQPPITNRDFTIPVTELKPNRRLHKTKSIPEQQQQQQQQPAAVYRLEGTRECLMNPDELSSVFAHVKHSHPNKKIVVYKTSTTPQSHEFNQLVDEMCIKHGVELEHSQNSPFQHYRSQSLQDLTTTSTTTTSAPFTTPRTFDYQFQPIEKQEQIRGNYIKKTTQSNKN